MNLNVLTSLQHCGSKNTVTGVVIGTGLLSSSFLPRSWSTNAKLCPLFPCPKSVLAPDWDQTLSQCFPVFVRSVVWSLLGKSTIAIAYLFSYTRNGKAIILHFGNRKDFKELVGKGTTTALFYFANTLIEKNPENRKTESGGFFFNRF